jgi:AMMECR1 domain-containing protein
MVRHPCFEGGRKRGWIVAAMVVIGIKGGWGQVAEKDWRLLEEPSIQHHLARLAYAVIVATVCPNAKSFCSPTFYRLTLPKGVLASLSSLRAGCFVTIERGAKVRGCRGTLQPTQPNLVEEIVRAAMAACHDRRYPPITPAELPHLSISITVVKGLTPLDDIRTLRPDEGLVVRRGEKVGIVLPYEGKDPMVRLAWGKRKARLQEDAPCAIWRLSCVRWKIKVGSLGSQ